MNVPLRIIFANLVTNSDIDKDFIMSSWKKCQETQTIKILLMTVKRVFFYIAIYNNSMSFPVGIHILIHFVDSVGL